MGPRRRGQISSSRIIPMGTKYVDGRPAIARYVLMRFHQALEFDPRIIE
jgi:hypothetical protein